jgi:membrane protease YdiL (CAAX protease family)
MLGLVVAFAPQVLLYVAASAAGTLEGGGTLEEVTVTSATVVLVSSLVLYGWQATSAWIFSLRISKEGLSGWGFVRPGAAFFWTIPAALAVSYAIAAVHQALVDPPPQDIVEQFPRTAGGGVLFFIVAVLLAPFFEELFFRGFLYKGFKNSWGWWPAALVSAALFSLAHLQITVFVPIFALGFALAWVYERTGSLWTSIVMHAVFNGLAVLAWSYGPV